MSIDGPISQITTLTCPMCEHTATEVMPTDQCIYYYQCMECGSLLTPEPGDCCVFCSYGSNACPPAQARSGRP